MRKRCRSSTTANLHATLWLGRQLNRFAEVSLGQRLRDPAAWRLYESGAAAMTSTGLWRADPGGGRSEPRCLEDLLRDRPDDDQEYRRPTMDVTTDGDTFAISKMQFAQQYASIYFARLVLLRSKIIERLSSSGLDERKVARRAPSIAFPR